jgi:hypothetical protein
MHALKEVIMPMIRAISRADSRSSHFALGSIDITKEKINIPMGT